MFQILILICSIDVPPAECQIGTALDLIHGPRVPNEVMCGLHGQAYIAQTSLELPRPGEYIKVKCVSPGTDEIARRNH